MPPTISIVITAYNRSHYLGTAIESVLNQTYRDFELLIWDDASTDNSLDIAYSYAKRDCRIRVIAAPHNTGFPPAIKAAVAATTGDYIGWVDSDDMLAPTAIEETSFILNNYPQVGLVYTDYKLMDNEGNLLGLGPRCQIPYSKERLLVDLMTFHFRLIRRSVYDYVGGIDSSFASGEDYDLCLKLSEVTEVYHIAKPLYYYRRHDTNVTNNKFETIRWAQKAINDALKRRGLDADYELDTHLEAFFSIKPKHHQGKSKEELEHPNNNNQVRREQVLEELSPKKNQKDFPLVSIIIPCYNPGIMIERCLQSCFEQTYPNIEIIIVDNNSTDGSIAIASQLATTTSHRVIFTHYYSQGQNYAFNHGFTLATGDYIQWLDADDELAPYKIALQVAALEQNPNFDIAYGDWEYCFYQCHIDAGNNSHQIAPILQCQHQFVFTSRQYDDYLLQTLSHNWQPPLSYLLRRQAAIQLQDLKAWNPHTLLATDREYYTIAAIIGLRFLYVPNALVRYNFWSPTQNSRKSSYGWRAECYKKMHLRFQEIAAKQPAERITEQYWFLLKQNWDLWKLAPVTLMQNTQDSFFLINRHTQSRISLSQAEARIVSALHKANAVYTLEDHAHKIVHLMAQHIVLSSGIDSYDKVVAELSKWVGIEHPLNHDSLTWKQPQSNIHSSPEIQALINTVPWFAPLFCEQRLAVFYTLDKLRNAGMLLQYTPVQSRLNVFAQ